jgi:malonate decarboxylase epsilon subunit
MTSVAVLFPGQGSQRPGMLHDLPVTGDDVLAQASAALGFDALELDTTTNLLETTPAQLALTVSSVAWYLHAVDRGMVPAYLCGHSVGLWAAAVCAGSLDLPSALRLIRIRGDAMKAASPVGSGMIGVEGIRTQELLRLTAQARSDGADAWVSVRNAPTVNSVSGTADGLNVLSLSAKQVGAQRVRRLDVAVPAHCPLMSSAAEQVRAELETFEITRPAVPLGGNVRPTVLRTASQLRHELWRGIDSPVEWARTTAGLHERGVDRWLQLPPGGSLARLAAEFGNPSTAVSIVGVDTAVARVNR